MGGDGGLTLLHTLAGNPKALDMIEFLARNGADLNARTNDGRSAYNIADAPGNKGACSLLVKLGAGPELLGIGALGPEAGAATTKVEWA